ncbi:MAG: sigma 54-interacting transcriptional regulator [Candidatus Riflebacteria bacterium]|nr:sigma 54-interacting transcriptional regulator [Candidatus Riflebacteria bacterium]
MEDLKRLKDIATQFFSEISPREITDLDRLFEQWKSGVHKKQEVNFGLALPPSMRDQVLRDIGFGEPEAEPGQEKYLGYLNLLNRMMEMNLEALLEMSPEELSAFIWKEGKRLGLRESEIRDLGTILPPWIQKISSKAIFEFSPINVFEVSHGEERAAPAAGQAARFQGIIGQSEKMQSMFSCIEKISGSTLSVLIQGESGTGKELVAHAIHANSPRAQQNFIPVNCGALPDSIIESELFGHEKGAFTGAVGQKIGFFEIANRGTIFLDEISETSLNFQVKLLRVLQERQIRRVGGVKAVDIDIRIIAATNRDLPTLVREGTFRHDLYYRINEMAITLPPLRERQGDLPLLIDHFLDRFARENRKPVPTLDPHARRLLFGYAWPGNIRELENVLKRAVVLADRLILPSHLPAPLLERRPTTAAVSGSGSLESQVMAAEREIITRALESNGHNVSLTARVLEVSRRTLQRKMKELGITKG